MLYEIGITVIPGIGDILAKKLIAYCGSVEGVFKEKKAHLMKIPGIGKTLADVVKSADVLKRAESEMEFISKYKIRTFFYLDKGYPQRLKNCIDGPVMLYYKGNADLNHPKIISMVGTRSATDYGKQICKQLVEGLVNSDVMVVSGLAFGIDVASHKAALDHHLKTIAVLAHGLDRIYPYLHKSLAGRIIQQGGLLTDFMSGTNPDRENFPKRNRIIAGLSDATIVVEAAKKGGALITAEIANSYNRDVFAVPGRIHDIYSEGCNYLIRTNRAALIQSAGDILEMMGWEVKNSGLNRQRRLFVELTPDETAIVDILKENGESSLNLICNRCELPSTRVAAALLSLEFQGVIVCLPGKMYKLV